VRSAYKLALQTEMEGSWQDGSSRVPEAPPKVRVFGWRLAHEGLAAQDNRKSWKLCDTNSCQICGMEDETGFHAVVRCTKVVALRQEMRAYWQLPGEDQFKFGRQDWLLLLLSSISKEVGAQILILFWQSWHMRMMLYMWRAHANS
jgi:hypothetical protein